MKTETTDKLTAPQGVAGSDLFCFRWWYKGKTIEGNIMKLEGRVVAKDASDAIDKVEKQMRAKWPTVRWMQGKEIEGDGWTFGPTVQKLKKPVKAAPPEKQCGVCKAPIPADATSCDSCGSTDAET